jgi:hypothetical protein
MADKRDMRRLRGRGGASADEEMYMIPNKGARMHARKERNPFSNLSTPQLEYTQESLFDKSTPEGVRELLDQELSRRGTAMKVAGAASLTDAGTGAIGGIASLTGLSKVPQVAKAIKPFPALGTAAGVVQGVAQVASGVNPYGVGMPSGWNVPIDAIEGSYGFTGPFYPVVQGLAGGILSEAANASNMDDERKILMAMRDSGDYKGIEEMILNYGSRDWDRGKLSQIFSSGLLEGENARRALFKDSYRTMANPDDRRRALDLEMDERYAFDQAMLHSDFLNKSIAGHNVRRNAGDGYQADKAQYVRDWVKSERERQKKQEEASKDWDFRSFGL